MLEHVHHQVPVTALAFFYNDVIISGEGPYIRIYNTSTKKRLANYAIFEDQAVHGIIVSAAFPSAVVVWGGCEVRVICPFDEEPEGFTIKAWRPWKTTDWILDAVFGPYNAENGEEAVAMVTAHNALIILPVHKLMGEGDSVTERTLKPTVPGSNCILYSAHVTWLSASKCLVASGTVFGVVIVWSASISYADDGTIGAQTQTHYTFSAHEGSVFGVQISSNLANDHLGECRRALATCSDDRTVRLWDISDLAVESPTLMQVQRDTGFGSKGDAEDHAPRCLAKAIGHVSRIWHVRFLSSKAAEPLQIMSFGEDASNITWTVKPAESGMPFTLEQTGSETAHAGKHIWSVAASGGIIATGGADGAIAARNSHRLCLPSKELDPPPPATGGRKDTIKAYAFIGPRRLLFTTEQGHVNVQNFDENGLEQGARIAVDIPNVGNYSLVAGVRGIVFIASASGMVHMFVCDPCELLIPVFQAGRKVIGLFAERVDHPDDRQTVHLIVTAVGMSVATYARFNTNLSALTGVSEQANLTLRTNVLRLPEGFVVTSCMFITYDTIHAVVLGSRTGSIAVYSLLEEDNETERGPCAVLPSTHGKEAMTSLHWYQTAQTEDHCEGYIHSTGRDGTHAVLRMWHAAPGWRAELVHQVSLPFGPNVEGLEIRPNGHVWVWGFRSKHFVVHDLNAQQEIMAVECGGANRTWAFRPHDQGGLFVWTKASKVFRQAQNRLPYELLNTGGHGREIKSMFVSPTEAQIIATGAEDTNIKLWTFTGECHSFRCLQRLRKHNTGVQHLQWSHDGRFLFSSGGFEEFFAWRITNDVPVIGVGVFCESVHPSSGTSDLRIMDFDIREDCSKANNDGEFEISMAYSDSTLKLWRYLSKERVWALVCSGDYLTACLTQVLKHPSPDVDTQMVTTATDGHLALWDAKLEDHILTWTSRHKVHQNAILSTATSSLPHGSGLIVTGGDDNAIGITRVSEDGDVKTLLLPRAHAAAVTGLAIMWSAEGKRLLASSGIDQRVKLWEISVDAVAAGVEGIEVKRLANVPTPVADVSSLEWYRFEDDCVGLIVAGVGMHVLRVPDIAW